MSADLLLAAVQRPASRLGAHLLLTVAVLGLFAASVVGMRRGWRRRVARQQAELPPLPSAPGDWQAHIAPMRGVYAGTVRPDAPEGWLARVVAHDLGRRGACDLVVTSTGVLISRAGEIALWLPAGSLRSVRIGDGLAGKVMPGSGMVIVGWEHAGQLLESGVTGPPSRYPEVIDAVAGLRSPAMDAGQEGAA